MIEYDREKLGRFLKESRENANLTQGEIASVLGYTSSQFISNIERGASVAPLKMLAKMLRVYKVGPEPLMKIILEAQERMLMKNLKSKAR